MGRRFAPGVLAVALLLVLAGCGGLTQPLRPGGDGLQTTGTVTPAPLPTDDRRADELAPGLTPTGVSDADVLAAAHVARLENRSYELVTQRTVRYPNGTLRERLSLNLSLTADREYLVHTATAGPAAPVFLGRPPANATFWSDGATYARALTRDGEATYNTFEPVDGAGTWQYWARTVPFGGPVGTPRTFLRDTFEAVPTRVVGRVTVDGQTAYRLAGDRAFGPLAPSISDPRNVTLRATVTPAGLVRSLSLSYVGTEDGRTVRVVRTVRYRVGNVTAPRPSWVDRAI